MSQRDPRRRHPFPSVLVLVAFACVLAAPSIALAAPKDAQAMKLDDDAINNDYLATKFGDAEKKLKQALALCAKQDACSPNVLAQLHRDLGIVYVVASKPDDAKAQFVEAIKVDPATKLPKELATPEIEQVFAAAKGGPAPAPSPAPGPPKPPAPAPAAPAGGDEIVHTPPAESAVLTPLPLYAELPEGMAPTKVIVRYKAFGAPEWKTADMKKLKTGYGVELPCSEIGSTPGELKYYIQAIGPGGDVLATNGTKNAPLKVVVKPSLDGEPPHLPGKQPPKPCAGGGGDICPPDFPGCKQNKKEKGAPCDADAECQSGTCKNGACFSEEAIETKCESDQGCETGQYCSQGVCTGPKKNWLGIAIQQDAIVAPAATNVCRDQGASGYTCFANDAFYDPGEHALLDQSDEVAAGFTPSTTRVMLAYDRVVQANITAGARVGYAFGGGPARPDGKAFLPVHAEARAAYWFGADPFIRVGVRPYVVGGAGAAQFDGKVNIKVYQGTSPSDAMPVQADAWMKLGTFFGTAGVGMMYAIDHNSGVTGELKAIVTAPTFGLGASLNVGYMMGLF